MQTLLVPQVAGDERSLRSEEQCLGGAERRYASPRTESMASQGCQLRHRIVRSSPPLAVLSYDCSGCVVAKAANYIFRTYLSCSPHFTYPGIRHKDRTII